MNAFLRVPKPSVISNGMPFSSIWELVSVDYGINLRYRGLCKLVYRHKILCVCILGHIQSILRGLQSKWSFVMVYRSVQYVNWSVMIME